MSSGQHRRTNAPLRNRLVRFVAATTIGQTGTHRRRKTSTGRRVAKERTRAGYQNAALSAGGTAA